LISSDKWTISSLVFFFVGISHTRDKDGKQNKAKRFKGFWYKQKFQRPWI